MSEKLRVRCMAIGERMGDVRGEKVWTLSLVSAPPQPKGGRWDYAPGGAIELEIYREALVRSFTVGDLYEAEFRRVDDA